MSAYIMDTPVEGHRIERKTNLQLTEQQLRQAGVRPGSAVLDLGCAAGTTSRLLGELVGARGEVLGVDGSHQRVDQARGFEQPNWVRYQQSDASDLSIADDTFDVAWSRFLFEYLPDPRKALDQMIRVTRPGGVVSVSDLDGNCVWHSPLPASLKTRVDAALDTLAGGFDPWVGRHLYGWFTEALLKDVQVDIRPYHVIAGELMGEELEQWRMKLAGVEQALTARGWDADRAATLTQDFEAFLRDPSTLTYSILFTVRGVV